MSVQAHVGGAASAPESRELFPVHSGVPMTTAQRPRRGAQTVRQGASRPDTRELDIDSARRSSKTRKRDRTWLSRKSKRLAMAINHPNAARLLGCLSDSVRPRRRVPRAREPAYPGGFEAALRRGSPDELVDLSRLGHPFDRD